MSVCLSRFSLWRACPGSRTSHARFPWPGAGSRTVTAARGRRVPEWVRLVDRASGLGGVFVGRVAAARRPGAWNWSSTGFSETLTPDPDLPPEAAFNPLALASRTMSSKWTCSPSRSARRSGSGGRRLPRRPPPPKPRWTRRTRPRRRSAVRRRSAPKVSSCADRPAGPGGQRHRGGAHGIDCVSRRPVRACRGGSPVRALLPGRHQGCGEGFAPGHKGSTGPVAAWLQVLRPGGGSAGCRAVGRRH